MTRPEGSEWQRVDECSFVVRPPFASHAFLFVFFPSAPVQPGPDCVFLPTPGLERALVVPPPNSRGHIFRYCVLIYIFDVGNRSPQHRGRSLAITRAGPRVGALPPPIPRPHFLRPHCYRNPTQSITAACENFHRCP